MAEVALDAYAVTSVNAAAATPNLVAAINDGTANRQIVVLGSGDGTLGIQDGSSANPLYVKDSLSETDLASILAKLTSTVHGITIADSLAPADGGNTAISTFAAGFTTVFTAPAGGYILKWFLVEDVADISGEVGCQTNSGGIFPLGNLSPYGNLQLVSPGGFLIAPNAAVQIYTAVARDLRVTWAFTTL